MNRCEDIGYDEESEDFQEGDLLEDIELLLQRKLDELFTRLQNSNKQTLKSIQILLSAMKDSTSCPQLPKEQEITKESETTL